jgi:hypothetical protein
MAKKEFENQACGTGLVYDKSSNITLPKPEKTGSFTVQDGGTGLRGKGAVTKKVMFDRAVD